jgi:hypothetical protein
MTSKDDWVHDLDPIQPADWDRARAKHLLNRAGFGGTPEGIDRLATLTPVEAVRRIIDYENVENGDLPAFEHSGVYDATLKVFPPSRPATTRKAETTGEAIGVRVKPGGSRRMQPVVDRFFFWLRATALETRRVAGWWADNSSAGAATSTASTFSTSSSIRRSPRTSLPGRFTATSCATISRRSCRNASARSSARTTTNSNRCCVSSSCPGISTASRQSAPASRGRSI